MHVIDQIIYQLKNITIDEIMITKSNITIYDINVHKYYVTIIGVLDSSFNFHFNPKDNYNFNDKDILIVYGRLSDITKLKSFIGEKINVQH
jgi:Trk K+ transport system NAD-binding subunit